MPLMSNPRPILALLYGATFWGLVWYPIRLLEQQGLSGLWLTLIAYTCATLCLLPFSRGMLDVLRRHPVDLLLLAVGSGWTNLGFVLALLEGEVARVLLLFYLNPLWATLLARLLLGERVRGATWTALPIGLAGGVLMLWHADQGLFAPWTRADWMALTAGMAFALTNTMTRKRADVGIRNKTTLSWLGVVVLSAVGVMLAGPIWPDVGLPVWGGALILGLAGFMVTTLLVIYGVTHMPVQRSAVILLFEIFVGAISAWLIVGESLATREWVGGGLIIIAGLIAALADRPRVAHQPVC